MQIATESQEQQLEEQKVIEFPRGLPGFEEERRFRLMHDSDSEAPRVHWLQSVEDSGVQLSVADPASLQVNYEIALSDEENSLLKLEAPEHCAVLVVLYRTDGESAIRANFLAPLLINTQRRIGMQKVLNAVEREVTIRSS